MKRLALALACACSLPVAARADLKVCATCGVRAIGVAQAFRPANAAQANPANNTLTAVPGIKVGSFTLPGGTTGCTVILVDGEGVPGGVSQRGGAPGTRETDLLNPLNMVDKVNAVVLSGGSAFGLDGHGQVARGASHRLGRARDQGTDCPGGHPLRPADR
jgi:L-aminopeptidase/D-esterase-like protein